MWKKKKVDHTAWITGQWETWANNPKASEGFEELLQRWWITNIHSQVLLKTKTHGYEIRISLGSKQPSFLEILICTYFAQCSDNWVFYNHFTHFTFSIFTWSSNLSQLVPVKIFNTVGCSWDLTSFHHFQAHVSSWNWYTPYQRTQRLPMLLISSVQYLWGSTTHWT